MLTTPDADISVTYNEADGAIVRRNFIFMLDSNKPIKVAMSRSFTFDIVMPVHKFPHEHLYWKKGHVQRIPKSINSTLSLEAFEKFCRPEIREMSTAPTPWGRKSGAAYVGLKEIGKGGFGIVDLVKDVSSRTLYARKSFPTSLGKSVYMKELKVMRRLEHVRTATMYSSSGCLP